MILKRQRILTNWEQQGMSLMSWRTLKNPISNQCSNLDVSFPELDSHSRMSARILVLQKDLSTGRQKRSVNKRHISEGGDKSTLFINDSGFHIGDPTEAGALSPPPHYHTDLRGLQHRDQHRLGHQYKHWACWRQEICKTTNNTPNKGVLNFKTMTCCKL